MTPTSRTLKYLRTQGQLPAITERWNSHTRQRKDLFGFIDIVSLSKNRTIGIQCTSAANLSSRIKKITTECRDSAKAWLIAGNEILVIGWRKAGPKGKRKTWKPTIRILTLEDLKR
jgi:hypothetical protein